MTKQGIAKVNKLIKLLKQTCDIGLKFVTLNLCAVRLFIYSDAFFRKRKGWEELTWICDHNDGRQAKG